MEILEAALKQQSVLNENVDKKLIENSNSIDLLNTSKTKVLINLGFKLELFFDFNIFGDLLPLKTKLRNRNSIGRLILQ